jgi:hypothetical protein
MINMDDFNAVYNFLMKADNKFSEDRSFIMTRDSGKEEIYFKAYIAGNNLTTVKVYPVTSF